MTITFLGTGTSHGVPRIGCNCDVCTSTDTRNQRYRCSLLIRHQGLAILIDTAPEFRLQAIRAHINHLDALFYTHSHADHINGIDDVRVFTHSKALDVYGPPQVLADIASRFSYALKNTHAGSPQLNLKDVDSRGVTIGNLLFIPIPLVHGRSEVFGYRIGKFAYLTDCKEIPPSSVKMLKGVETVVLDALRFETHPTHMSIDEAIDAAVHIGAKTTYFTHLNHRIDHQKLQSSLPPSFIVAYDGLTVSI
ncbi:MAG: MBL fold metallo-hydrolase [Sphaerochaetaceae bacterium]